MSERTTGQVADTDLLASWEGPAEHAPGVLFDASEAGGGAGWEPAANELAAWVAVTAISGIPGHSASEAIKAKVLGTLTALRRRQGHGRIDELKQQVFEEMRKHRSGGKLKEEELKGRIDAFFAEIRE
jgi:hypothetical protein